MADASLAFPLPAAADGAIVRLDVYRAFRALQAQARCAKIAASHPGGFETSIHTSDGCYSISIGGLVQDFETLEEALHWAARAQRPDRRLRIDFAGRHPVRWTLEHITPEGTVEAELVSGRPHLIASLFHRRTEYRSNAAPFDSEDPES